MHNAPELSFELALQSSVDRGGLTESSLDALRGAFPAHHADVKRKVSSGELGFWELPATQREGLTRLVERLSSREHEDIIVCGIGGSSLGGIAALHALLGAPSVREARGITPRFHFLDNSDPWQVAELLPALDPQRTSAIVISKSGRTVETAAQYLVVRDWLSSAGVTLGDHLIFVTDPEHGVLRGVADKEGIPTFEIPQNVGGRFSVLTPVGLVPMALAGIDVSALLDGAAAMAETCEATSLDENPAGMLAALLYAHHVELGHSVHVLMPYSDALRPFAAWFVQLWAESLGKRESRGGEVVETGPTPLPAVGATDQHAQLQLFAEGPRDKVVVFIDSAPARDVTLPLASGDLAYLSKRTLGELLRAELQGTRAALASSQRPSITLSIPVLDAHTLGGLFFFFEAATAFAGEYYDVNAFDQPGVEASKRIAYGLMGREGFEEDALKATRSESGAVVGFGQAFKRGKS